MSALETVTGKSHLSYSALDNYLQCGERFRLERVVGVRQQPAWWFIGGSAFHTATERWDKGEDTNLNALWSDAWKAEYDQAVTQRGFKDSDVRSGGRATKAWPNKENEQWWQFHGPQMLASYATWRTTSGWNLAEDGVEIPVEFSLGQTPVHGYVDRLFIDPDGQPVVVDLKTGGRAPASTLQLAVYAAGIEAAMGFRPILGAYYMARQGELTQVKSVQHLTPELLGRWFDSARDGIERERFIPHVTALCGTCSVAQFCEAQGGTPPALVPHTPPF